MGERERNSDSDQDCKVDIYSDSFCSSEFESTMSQSSHHSYPINSFSPASVKRYSTRNQVLHSQALGKPKPNDVPNRKRFHEGFNSQSLPKIPLQKDSVVTKRILTARPLTIDEWQNNVTELYVKLDELIQENKVLKRLQYKHEKALNKFEDTENEASQLIARHNNEITALKECLRKTQEKELATEKRMKDTEGELLRTKHSLQKLKKISEAKHLLERNDLAKKLVSAELKLDNTANKIKELEKHLQLNTSSFQIQLIAERKKTAEAQKQSKILRKQLQQLQQKLKEKEREADIKNTYFSHLPNSSIKKKREYISRKNAACQVEYLKVYTKEIQTEEFMDEKLPQTLKQNRVCQENDKDKSTVMERKDHFIKDPGLLDECKREKSAKNQKEKNSLLERQDKAHLETGRCNIDMTCIPNTEEGEEKQKREMLIAKLNEIDQECQDAQNFKCAPLSLLPDRNSKLHTPESSPSKYTFSETERVLNRSQIQNNSLFTTKDDNTEGNIRRLNSPKEFSFGSYVPSFAKTSGKSSPLGQMNIENNNTEKCSQDDRDPTTRRERKARLMEELFGTNSSIILSQNGNRHYQSNSNADLECEREKSAINPKEKNSLLERQDRAHLETRRCHIDTNWIPNTEEGEEKQKRGMLIIPKLNEIDGECQDAQNFKCAPLSLLPDRKSKLHTPESSPSKYTFSETERVLNRSQIQNNSLFTTKDDNTEGNIRRLNSPKEFSFGSYVPSFAKTSGKSSSLGQMNIENNNTEKCSQDDRDPTTRRERKARLMEELFGTNSSIILSQNDEIKFIPTRRRLKHADNTSSVKVADYVEDENEEGGGGARIKGSRFINVRASSQVDREQVLSAESLQTEWTAPGEVGPRVPATIAPPTSLATQS
ncbi:lebercilin-like [Suncus etruscus]|uniref:lebercilin-like n=1 Tax=Suncus etruscus TaxID=109475 RepID=UPI0021102551|nr:lebercilin-like [Suncus etruscus]